MTFVYQFYAPAEGEASPPTQDFAPHHGGLSSPMDERKDTVP